MNLIDKIVCLGITLSVGSSIYNDIYYKLYPNAPKGFWRSLLSSHNTGGKK